MSHVTAIILITPLGDGAVSDETPHPNVDKLNAYLKQHHNSWLVETSAHAGGSKVMGYDIFMGAFNFLKIPEFLNAFHQVPWENPKDVQLFLADEHDERFKEYSIASLTQPALIKRQIRAGGVGALAIGIAVILGSWLSWQFTGNVILVLLAIPIVFIPGGIYMIVTGKIPNQK